MSTAHDPQRLDQQNSDRWRLRDVGRAYFILCVCCAAGVGTLFVSLQFSVVGSGRFMSAYLVAFAFCLSLSLGALFFLITQHLCRAGWSVLIRRPAEVFAANLPVVALMFIPIASSVLSGQGDLYSWARADSRGSQTTVIRASENSSATAGSETSHLQDAQVALGPEKRAILNPPFFIGRWFVFLALWSGMGVFYWWNSVCQDRDRDIMRTARMERFAGPAALLFGLSVTWAAFDLLMSLNPKWQSTMFGVYYFAGTVVGGLSLITLATIWLRGRGQLPMAVGTEHYLDLGRLMFGFVFFWGYIAFSQYMLLWYANIPSELTWLRDRGATTAVGESNDWSWLILFLLFGHLLIPFAGLMSRHIKKRPGLLVAWAVWLLVCHYLDLVWIVLPELGPQFRLGLIELGIMLTLGSIFLITAVSLASLNSLLPIGDPRISESLHHESAY